MENISDLKSKAVNGSLWSMLEQFSMLFVQFVVGVILARLLSPGDYGLLALTIVFSGVSAAVTDGGFEKSLIHKKDLSSVQINTIFFINIALGLVMVFVIILFAPMAAIFFNAPKLTIVLRVMSVGIIINAAGQTPSALLRKHLAFKKISYSHIFGSVLGGITGIVLAINGGGVWALVISTLTSQLIMLLGYLYCSSWRPKLEFSYSSIKSMLSFGLTILFSSIVFFVIQQFNNMAVGRYYDKTQLGLFHRGSRLPELITSVVEGVVLKMAFPVFSKVQDNNEQLSEILKKTIQILAFITFPLMTILFSNARDLTIMLFTKKWEGSIVFLEFFCIVKLFYPFIIIYKEVLLVKGHAALSSKILVGFSIVEIICVLAFISHGVIYVIISSLIMAIFQYLTYLWFFSKKINISVIDQLGWIGKYVFAAFLVFLATVITDKVLNFSEISLLLKLLIKLLVGGQVYILFAFVLKMKETVYIKNVTQFLTKRIDAAL